MYEIKPTKKQLGKLEEKIRKYSKVRRHVEPLLTILHFFMRMK